VARQVTYIEVCCGYRGIPEDSPNDEYRLDMPGSAWHIKLQPGQPYLSPGQEMVVEIDVPMAKATGQFVRPLPRFALPVLPHSYLYAI
jgi:hypothetical protein